MSDLKPTFGRRSDFQPAPAQAAAAAATSRSVACAGADSGAAELRTACLARLDASQLADATSEQLQADIERLISEIADEKHIQINGREQRQLAGELVHDMVGLGPLEPLLDDELITDIMVNGPDKVFVERRGKLG